MKLLHYLVLPKHAKIKWQIQDYLYTRYCCSLAVISQPVGQLVSFDKLHASEASAYTALMMPQKIAGYFAPWGENKHGGEGYFQVQELHGAADVPKIN